MRSTERPFGDAHGQLIMLSRSGQAPVPETCSLSQDLCLGCSKAASLVNTPSSLQHGFCAGFPSTPQLPKSQRSDRLEHSGPACFLW